MRRVFHPKDGCSPARTDQTGKLFVFTAAGGMLLTQLVSRIPGRSAGDNRYAGKR